MIQPSIRTLKSKQLIGLSISMSVIDNKTGQLWGSFMPRLKEIDGRIGQDKISMQVYPATYHQNFNPAKEFVKWATVEVSHIDHMPEGMQSFELDGGLYAVFDYKGSSSDPSIFQYIFSEWLPKSGYQLDVRPHFEVLGEKYKNNDPNSEEEIWIPIRPK